jgi:hypothetical protein
MEGDVRRARWNRRLDALHGFQNVVLRVAARMAGGCNGHANEHQEADCRGAQEDRRTTWVYRHHFSIALGPLSLRLAN